MSRAVQRDSRRLSWLLRHGAVEMGLPMDPAGWAAVPDVLRVLDIGREVLERAVAENDKDRLEFDGDSIRACQGHSIAGTPVTLAALEASWEPTSPHRLWHGTSLAAVPGIGRSGLEPGTRTHVHLAARPDSKTGKRANVEVLLEISGPRLRRAGIEVHRAPNGVLLARHVPAAAIVDVAGVRVSAAEARRAGRTAGLPSRTGRAGSHPPASRS